MKEQGRLKQAAALGAGQNSYALLGQIYQEAFKSLIPLQSKVDAEQMDQFLHQFRDSTLLLRYASALKKLAPSEANHMLSSLASCMDEKLSHQFPACRYENHVHLDKIFDENPDLKKGWTKGEKLPLTELLPSSFQAVAHPTWDLKEVVKNSFAHQHVKPGSYPALFNYLQADTPAERARIKQNLVAENEAKLNPNQGALFQLKLMELLEADCGSFNKLVQEAIAYLPKESDALYSLPFDNDIKDLQSQFHALTRGSTEPVFVVETDDLVDLFACGTEVDGSCQIVDGSPDLNKCLLAYVRDGKNRLIAIKNKEGKIKARAIVRLLLDAATNQPVIFLEESYPHLLKAEWQKGLEAMAKRKAQALHLPLFSQQEGCGQHPLLSLGGPAPYEYVDALDRDRVVKDGKFRILHAYEIKE
jgi:hypothetical protein